MSLFIVVDFAFFFLQMANLGDGLANFINIQNGEEISDASSRIGVVNFKVQNVVLLVSD